MDGVGRVQMTLSQLGRRYQWPVGVRFYYWARWARFFIINKCIIVNKMHLYTSHPILWLTGAGNGLGMDI